MNVCTLEEYFKCLKKLEGKEHLYIGMHMHINQLTALCTNVGERTS